VDKCKSCGSQAINPGKHGRDLTSDLDLCDVCAWRKRAEDFSNQTVEMGKLLDGYSSENEKLLKIVDGYAIQNAKLSKLVEEATEKIKSWTK